jgi:hypothetical protein
MSYDIPLKSYVLDKLVCPEGSGELCGERLLSLTDHANKRNYFVEVTIKGNTSDAEKALYELTAERSKDAVSSRESLSVDAQAIEAVKRLELVRRIEEAETMILGAEQIPMLSVECNGAGERWFGLVRFCGSMSVSEPRARL